MIIDKVIGDKRRWREYRARVKKLPENYREAVDAIQHYVLIFGPADGDSAATMFDDLADLFERAAVDGTAIREIVGTDPAGFVDTFLQNYTKGGWVTKERNRLIAAIDRAAADGAASQGESQ